IVRRFISSDCTNYSIAPAITAGWVYTESHSKENSTYLVATLTRSRRLRRHVGGVMSDPANVFHSGTLTIAILYQDTTATIAWEGVSDAPDVRSFLSPLMARLSMELVGKAVTIDFRRLEYMNSATLAPVLAFIKNLDARGISTTLLYDIKVQWQR